MNQYIITFSTMLTATKPEIAAQKVAEGLLQGDYQRLTLAVMDVATMEKTEQVIEVEADKNASTK